MSFKLKEKEAIVNSCQVYVHKHFYAQREGEREREREGGGERERERDHTSYLVISYHDWMKSHKSVFP